MVIFSGRIEKAAGAPVIDRGRRAGQDVGDADEAGDEGGRRMLVDFGGRADLLDAALVEHGDAVAHAQRLALVVGHVDEGDADPALDRLQLDLHLLAQLEVERAQRLVQQQHARPVDQRARQRHALALAARQLVRLAAAEAAERHHLQHLLGRAPGAPASGTLRIIRPIGDVLRRRSCAGTARSPGTRC